MLPTYRETSTSNDRQGNSEPSNMAAPSRPAYGPWHWSVLFLFLAAFGYLYLFLADHLVSQTNKDVLASDQKHNMRLALQARDDRAADIEAEGLSVGVQRWFPHRTDGVVNPLWPWVASWFAPPGMIESNPDEVTDTDREFFRRGKWVNVAIVGAFLLVVGMTVGRTFTLAATVNLVVLLGLGAFLPRAVFFQPEPLYYLFFFLSWVCCVAILKQNSAWLYAALGLVAGLAYLAKTSIAPLLLVFLLVSTYRFLGALFPWMLGAGGRERGTGTVWSCQSHFIGLAFFAFAFITTVGARLDYANRTFGDPFHSYPSYWMWMDDFPTAFQWMVDHGDRQQLEAIPEDEKPSPRTYFATHTGVEAQERLYSGLRTVLTKFFDPPVRSKDGAVDGLRPWVTLLPLRGVYLGWLLVVLTTTAGLYTLHRRRSTFPSQRLQPGALPIALFVVGAFVAYALAYAWYAPIGKGDRFLVSLYAPLVWSLIAGAESIIRRVRRRNEYLWICKVYTLLHLALTAALAWRVYELVSLPLFAP
ncbi:hypothetical protein BH23VER1_BH23VER1_09260 [soil metagenome]